MIIRKHLLASAMHRALLGSVALTVMLPTLAFADESVTPAVQETSADTTKSSETTKPKKAAVSTLGEVVVTAQSREQSLQDVPITVQVISDVLINQVAATDLSEMDVFIPGLQVSGTSPTQPSYSVRGVGTGDFGIGTDPAVGVYVDGVYSARSGSALLAFNDIERVEILKGPQGTLFGRNSAAGAVSIISKKPGDIWEGRVRLRGGDEGRQYADALINAPISDVMALRVNVSSNRSEGWQRDAATGQRYGGDGDWASRAAFRWDISDKTQMLFSWDHEVLDQLARPAIGVIAIPQFGWPTVPPDKTEYLDPRTAPIYNDVVNNEESRHFDGMTLTFSHDSDWATITSTTAWRGFDTVNREDEDGTNKIYLYLDTANRESNTSRYQEFKFSGANDRVDWVAGTSYYSEHANQVSEVNAFTDSIDTAVFNAAGLPIYTILDLYIAPFSVKGFDWRESMFNETDITAMAAFGDVIWHLSDRMNLTTGLRYTHDSKKFSWLNGPRVATELDATLAQLELLGVFDSELAALRPYFNVDIAFDLTSLGLVEGQLYKLEDSWSDFSPRVVLDYRVNDDLMWYGSLAKGYKAGGYNSVQVNSRFDNEDVWNSEFGFKAAMPDQRIQINGSLYYYVYQNKQSIRFSSTCPGGSVGCYLVDNSDLQAWGVDLDAQWQVTDAFGLMASVAFIDATYKEKITPPPASVDVSGEPTGEPFWSAAMGGNYRWTLGENGSMEFSLLTGYRGKGRCNADSQNQGTCQASPNFKNNTSQSRTDLRLTWTSIEDRWALSGYVNNVFDNRYAGGVGGLAADVFGTPTSSVTPPRTWGVEARMSF